MAAVVGPTAAQPPTPSSWAEVGELGCLIAAAVLFVLAAFAHLTLGTPDGVTVSLVGLGALLTAVAHIFHRVAHGTAVLTAVQDAIESSSVGRP